MEEQVYPAEKVYVEELASASPRWTVLPIIEKLKAEARQQGLWNLFLPDISGLTQLEYAHLAEIMGRSPAIAPEALNCSAPG
jgi:acyl-CoA dehydrogenase